MEGRFQSLELQLQDAVSIQRRAEIFKPRHDTIVRWIPPPQNFVKMNVDGAAKISTGAAAAAGVCRNTKGEWIFGFSEKLENKTAYQAELYAIWKGLQLVWSKGFKRVIVESDSAFVIQQLQTVARGSGSRCAIEENCRELISRDWECNLQWVYREANKCADMMAKIGIDSNQNSYVHDVMPDQVRPQYEADLTGLEVFRSISL